MVWFTEDDLRAAAGDGSFRRGREYVDAVGELRPTALGVRAAVRGKNVYEVWLGRDNDALVGECGCPFGVEGNFCKHCVAVGLALLASGASGPEADIEAYVRSLEQRELVELLLAQANRDPDLYRRLALRAGSTGAPQVAVINEAAARTYWPGESPLNQSIILQGPTGDNPTEIVGIVATARHDGPRQPVKPEVFVPAAQVPPRMMTLVV